MTRLEAEHVTPVQLQGFVAESFHDAVFGLEAPTAFLILRSAATAINMKIIKCINEWKVIYSIHVSNY
jgi:hypothetical protein